MITLEQAKQLKLGQVVYDVHERNADGSPKRWRVNGKVKTWKRDPGRVRIPMKHGPHTYGDLTDLNLHLVCLTEEEANG